MTRTLLSSSHAPLHLWVEAALTSVYLINLLPTPLLKWSSPYSLLFQQPPNFSHLRTFGCAYFSHVGSYVTNKLMSHSVECVFLGYSLQHKSYRCLDPSLQHVIFDETHFPFAHLPSTDHTSSPTVELELCPVTPSPPPPLVLPEPPSPAESPPPTPTLEELVTSAPAPPPLVEPPDHRMVTRHKAGIHRPLIRNDGTVRYPSS